MDARSAAIAACLCLFALITGCFPPNGGPTARPPTDDSSTSVGSDGTATRLESNGLQTVGDVEPELEPVQRWIEQIERIDDVGARVAQQQSRAELNPPAESAYDQGSTTYQPQPEGTPAGQGTELTGSSARSPGSGEGEDPTRGSRAPSAQAEMAPVLGQVTVRAARSAPPTESTADLASPSVNAPAEAAGPALTLTELTEQWLDQPAGTAFRDQLDRRLLLVLRGDYERARQPLEMASTEQQRMAAQLVEALIAIREGHGGDPGPEANRVLTHVEALAESLLPLSDLRIPTLALTRAVRGFGRYEALDPPTFLTGRESEFVVYCEVENFLSRLTDDGGYESLFSLRTTVLNRAGDVVLELNDEHIADRCRTRRHDCFIPRLVRLPGTLSPGEYVVKTTIVDKIGAKVAERRTTFRIVARS